MRTRSKQLQAIGRAVALTTATMVLYTLWLACSVLLLTLPKVSRRWRHVMFRRWAKLATLILGLKLDVWGVAPRPPFLLVSNHLSYVDIIVLAAQLDCIFVAKQEIKGWPVLGLLCRSMGTIFVNRNSRRDVVRVMSLIEQAMKEGQGVVLFAEATSTEGSTVRKFHSALLEPAARKQIPVSYASLTYRTPPGALPAQWSVCWWGDMPFLSHFFRLLQVNEFRVQLVFGQAAISHCNRKVLATQLWQAVKAQFIPVVSLEEECSPLIH